MNAMHTIVRAFRGEVWIGRVAGESMLPTLGPGDLVVCEQISGRTGGVTRGMIVVLRGADPRRGLAIKRLVGLPGDSLSLAALGEGVVPPGQCLVLGDNRRVLGDSRLFGPLELDHLVARVVLVAHLGPEPKSTGDRRTAR